MFTMYKWDVSEFQYPEFMIDEKETYAYMKYVDFRVTDEVQTVYDAICNFSKDDCRPTELENRTIIPFWAFGLDGFLKEDQKLLRQWSSSILDLDKMIHKKELEEFIEKQQV